MYNTGTPITKINEAKRRAFAAMSEMNCMEIVATAESMLSAEVILTCEGGL